jgi:hypothetical protein
MSWPTRQKTRCPKGLERVKAGGALFAGRSFAN